MTELFVDDHTLYTIAKGLQARQAVLDYGGAVSTANEAFTDVVWMEYNSETIPTVLEENTNLNETLIAVLEAKFIAQRISKTEKREGLDEAVILFKEVSQKYEVLRRMTAYDAKCVIIQPL